MQRVFLQCIAPKGNGKSVTKCRLLLQSFWLLLLLLLLLLLVALGLAVAAAAAAIWCSKLALPMCPLPAAPSLLLQLSQLHPHNHGLNNVGLCPLSPLPTPRLVVPAASNQFVHVFQAHSPLSPCVCVCLYVCAIVCMHIKFNRMYSLYSMLASPAPLAWPLL